MDKGKIISLLSLVLILGVGGFAVNFYMQNVELEDANRELRQINANLQEERNVLEQRHRRAADENRQLSQRLDSMQRQLTQIERERDDLRDRYRRISEERDTLAERLRDRPEQPARVTPIPRQADVGDEYWADFVQGKAELEAELEQFEQTLLDIQSDMAQLKRQNRELELNAEELGKEKERLEQELQTKERALRITSMDLVSERQRRGQAVDEVQKLRGETTDLKRELMVTNERKSRVQNRLKDVLEEKNTLSQRMAEAESILMEKSLTFEELQVGLGRAIREGKRVTKVDPGSVELPPIVVRPEVAPDLRGLRGEIIAVNAEERFVVFDLGEDSGVRPGILMRVMRGDREVATIEVVETRRSISAADIKDITSGLDIREGDIVISR